MSTSKFGAYNFRKVSDCKGFDKALRKFIGSSITQPLFNSFTAVIKWS